MTTGVGEPLIGKLIVIGSPALTRSSFLPRPPVNPLRSNDGFSRKIIFFKIQHQNNQIIPFSGLARIPSDESLGSPGPASLTAVTRYSYSLFGVTLSSTKFVP